MLNARAFVAPTSTLSVGLQSAGPLLQAPRITFIRSEKTERDEKVKKERHTDNTQLKNQKDAELNKEEMRGITSQYLDTQRRQQYDNK